MSAGVCARTGQIAMLCVVTVAPWMFGGLWASAQLWLFGGVAVALLCWLVQQALHVRPQIALPTALVPLVCGIGLGLLQLVPLAPQTVAIVSPQAARFRAELAPGSDPLDVAMAAQVVAPQPGARQPLSLYPTATRHDLAMLVLATAAFLCGAMLFRTSSAALWLCGVIAVNGAAMAFFELVQYLKEHDGWRVVGGPEAVFGPFLNRNHAGGFLNLCLAGGLGLLVAVFSPAEAGDSAYENFADEEPHWSARLVHRWRSLIDFQALALFAVSLAGCMVAAVLCTMSRGAGLAMICAVTVTAVVLIRARRDLWRLWLMGAVLMAGVALLGVVGRSGAWVARMATLTDRHYMAADRIPHWRDGLTAAGAFLVSGSGLGTYRYAYEPFQERCAREWYPHAENQALEALLDGGILGPLLMVAMAALVGAACWQLLHRDASRASVALAVAGIFALTTQMIQGCFDFGLYRPSNMLLLALLCGAVCGRAALAQRQRFWSGWFALPGGRFATLLAVVVLLGGVAWGATEIHRTAIVEAAGGNTLLNSVRLPNPLDRQLWTADASLLPLADVESAMGRLEAAVQKSPDDAGARFHLAELHIARYRIRASEQMQEEALRQNPAAKINEAAVWAKTWPMVLHRAAHYLSRNGLTRQLHDLRTRRVVTDDLLPALKHAMAARNLCPLLPEVHEMIAELSVLATDPADDSVHVERAMRVRPGNPEDLRDCAMLDADAGRMERACRTWRRTLAMVSDDRFYILEEILKQAGMHMTPREIVAQIVPDSLPFLLRIARTIYTAPEQADARQAIADRMEQCLPQSTLPEDERCYYQGAAYALRGRYPQAIENYTRAVEMRSCSADAGWRGGAVPWRYELAMLLQGQGMLREAHEEALRCARQEPLNTAYRTLLEQINHNRVISEAAPE